MFFSINFGSLERSFKDKIIHKCPLFSLIMSRFKIRSGHYGGIVEIYVHYEYKEYIIYTNVLKQLKCIAPGRHKSFQTRLE